MGSWYGTCGLTNLPLVDEEVVMLVLQYCFKNSGSDDCYSHDRWDIAGFPVFGTYDDYGRMAMNLEDAPIWAINGMILGKKLIPHKDDGEYSRIASFNAKDALDVDTFQEAIHEDVVRVRSFFFDKQGYMDSNGEAPVGRMFILKRVWDDLIKKGFYTSYEGVTQDLDFYKNKCREYFEKQLNLPQVAPVAAAMSRLSRRISLSDHYLRGHDGRCLDGPFNAIIGYIDVHQLEHFDANVERLIDRFAQMIMIDNFVNNLRKAYSPSVGAGSQNDEYDLYRILIESMQSVMKEREDECARWDRPFFEQLELDLE